MVSTAPFFTSEANESHATFSPDGRWLAYVSDQSGRFEVYVRPYPGPEPATLISGDGGQSPAWSVESSRGAVAVGRAYSVVSPFPLGVPY